MSVCAICGHVSDDDVVEDPADDVREYAHQLTAQGFEMTPAEVCEMSHPHTSAWEASR